MGRQKLKKYAENSIRDNVVEPGKPIFDGVKGKWRELVFKNNNEVELELACGRGEYTTGLAKAYPEKNFIGVDLKGNRIWTGSGVAITEGLGNAAFLRTVIQNLDHFFEPGEVSGLWIVFPDPRPRNKDQKRRLTHPRFLEIYRRVLQKDGWVRFKTDNPGLFEYTLEVLKDWPIKDLTLTRDLYESPLYEEHHGIVTRYEKMFTEKGFKVNYLKFRFLEENEG